MERLTTKRQLKYGTANCLSTEYVSRPIASNGDEIVFGKAIDRLAAYEDKGVAPEDTLSAVEMAKVACKLTVADAYIATGLMPERVAELAQAEKDGRLVVLVAEPHLKPTKTNEVFICEGGRVWPIYVTGCEVGPNSEGRLAVIYETLDGDMFCDTDIRKTIFLTRQEAEEAMRKEESQE